MLDALHKQIIAKVHQLEADGKTHEAIEVMQDFLRLRETVLHTEEVLNKMSLDVKEIGNTADVLQTAVNEALEAAGFTCINGDWMSPVQYKEWLANEHVYGELQSEILDEIEEGGDE